MKKNTLSKIIALPLGVLAMSLLISFMVLADGSKGMWWVLVLLQVLMIFS